MIAEAIAGATALGNLLFGGATAAEAAGAAGTAATVAKGALGAEGIGKVGAGIAKAGKSIADVGSKVASHPKFAKAVTDIGTGVANAGQKVASKGAQLGTAEKNLLGEDGSKIVQQAGNAAIAEGGQQLKNQFSDTGTTAPTNAQTSNQFVGGNVASDENLKDAEPVETDPIKAFADIDAYLYKYKPGAQEMYGDTGKVNDKENFGVMAQDLAQNPLTSAAVNKDENGYLEVDGSRLSTMNTAVIGELCKRIMNLEAMVYGGK